MKKLLVTGGGSGGHVTPALAVLSEVHAAGWSVVYVGSNSGLEEALVTPLAAQTGVRYRGIASGKLRRYFSWQNISDALFVVLGCAQALWVVGRERPTVVFSKGGFVAFPVVLAAWIWRVPVVAHESDATPGLANKLSAPFVRTLCTSFPDTAVEGFTGRVVYTGAPIRSELLAGDAGRGRAELGVPDGRKVLLVTGGSLGAQALNEAVLAALDDLTHSGEWFVVHICGPGKVLAVTGPAAAHYRAFEFVSAGWADMLAAAELVVTRAGANTLFELLTLGKPNLLIPLPRQGSRGDQLDNAAYAQANGYSVVLPQEELTAARLAAAIATMSSRLDEWRAAVAQFARRNHSAGNPAADSSAADVRPANPRSATTGAAQIAAEILRLSP